VKVNIQATGIWDVIKSGTGDFHEDRSAVAVILCAMPLEMQAGLTVKPMTHEAWKAIQKVHLGAD
jgi:hypothetical protein